MDSTQASSSSSYAQPQENGGAAPSYADAFPPLATPSVNGDSSPGTQHPPVWGPIQKITPIKQSVSTQMFEIPYEERRFKEVVGGEFGAEQSRHCAQVQAEYEVHIELHSTKGKGLTVLITGRHDFVVKAAAELRKRLQTQSSLEMHIPPEFHRFLVGKKGTTLQHLKDDSGCDIQLPRDSNSSLIKIFGPKDNLEKARHAIQCIYDEMSRKATEVLDIPKAFHPFISGPHNSISDKLMQETGTRINIPPFFALNENYVRVSGEKESVAEAARKIRQLYEDAKQRAHTVSIEIPKPRHRFVIGPRGSGLHDILASTGVSVEVPHSDDPSESIVLRGESAKLGLALTQVYEKAESIATLSVVAPSWMHRRIIGHSGENLSQITAGYEKVQINFLRGEDKISIEGPREEAEIVQRNMLQFVQDFLKNTTMVEMKVPAKFHRNVIGKGGSIVNRIREETGCLVRVPGAGTEAEDVIRIEGQPKQVEIAKKELFQLVSKLENEKNKDLIIEQRFHRALIGQKGAKISEIRDKFPEVIVKFPDSDSNSEVVQLRGPKDDVIEVEKLLKKAYKELKETSFERKVKIFKEYHKDIIGKKGQTIAKIRDETNTRIQLPDSGAKSDVITVIGREKEVNKAVKMIEDIQSQVAQISEEVVNVPPNVHQSIIGPGGAFVRQIQDEHRVHVHFPPSDSHSDRVTVRGNKADVKAAVKALKDIATEKKQFTHTETLHAKPEFHRFLIGRSGQNIEQLRKDTGARILFPDPDDKDPKTRDLITIVGSKEAALKARAALEERVTALENTVEEAVDVDKKWHREFMERRGYYVNKISSDCGGVRITFPKDPQSSQVWLKGPRDCVRDAKQQLQDIVADLAARVTVELEVEAKNHRSLIGHRGAHVRDICDRFDVKINFPGEDAAEPDKISIAGKPEQCELAKQALLDLVPITESVPFPFEFHGALIGRGGEEIRALSSDNEVSVSIPQADLKEDAVLVTGVPAAVAKAREDLKARLGKFEEERADREARSYQVEVTIPQKFHRQIIGPKGSKIRGLQTDLGVHILIPGPQQESDVIRITGYKEKAEACKKELEKLGDKLSRQTTAELMIINRVHPILIGQRGKNLRALMDQFDVEIEMPGRGGPPDARDTVRVTGLPEAVDDACDHLLGLASDMIDRMIEKGELDPRQKEEETGKEGKKPKKGDPGFSVRDAPWNQELQSNDHFPAIGEAPARASPTWGAGAPKLNHK